MAKSGKTTGMVFGEPKDPKTPGSTHKSILTDQNRTGASKTGKK